MGKILPLAMSSILLFSIEVCPVLAKNPKSQGADRAEKARYGQQSNLNPNSSMHANTNHDTGKERAMESGQGKKKGLYKQGNDWKESDVSKGTKKDKPHKPNNSKGQAEVKSK